jgi:hypothetical protein
MPGLGLQQVRRRLWHILAALLISAAAAEVVNVTILLPTGTEWSRALSTAQDAAAERFILSGRAMDRLGSKDLRAARAVIAHHSDCYPPETAWLWARFRESPQEVENAFAKLYIECLESSIAEADGRGPRPTPQI